MSARGASGIARVARVVAVAVAGIAGVACAPGTRPHPAASRVASASPISADAGTAKRDECPLAEITARHAAALGPAFSHPVTLRGRHFLETADFPFVLSWDEAHHVRDVDMGFPLETSWGVDAAGPWVVGEGSVFQRLKPDEVGDRDILVWLLRRRHLEAMRRGAAVVTCSEDKVTVAFDNPGQPALLLDRATALPLMISARSAAGGYRHTLFNGWSVPDAGGARYPLGWDTPSEGRSVVERADAMPPCDDATPLDRSAPSATAAPRRPACLAASPPRFVLPLPPGGVRLPASFALHQNVFRARIGKDQVWAALDSGMTVSALDSTQARGAAFVAVANLTGDTVSSTVEMGVGTLPALSLGRATMRSLPVTSVPLSVLASMGTYRPGILLGLSFFEATTVRLDFGRSEIAFLPPATAAHAPDALAVPMRLLDGRLIVNVDVEGHAALSALDTGSAVGLGLDRAWVDQEGLLRGRPTQGFVAATVEAGTSTTALTMFRARTIALGPFTLDAPMVDVVARPGDGSERGLVGNLVLSVCRAAVFDLPARTLWLEPPCRRHEDDNRFGWRLQGTMGARGATPQFVVAELLPGGSAERAGLAVGDRVISVGRAALGADLVPLTALSAAAVGTKLDVVVERHGVRTKLTMTLVDLLPLPPGGG